MLLEEVFLAEGHRLRGKSIESTRGNRTVLQVLGAEREAGNLADQNSASWNRIEAWLTSLNGLEEAA